jgi:phosphatidylglycerophosphatase A
VHRRSGQNARPLTAILCATVFGVVYAPVAPRTFGSQAGLLVWWALPPSPAIQAFLILLLFVLGVWSGSVAGRHFQADDPGPVVLDEVVGMLLTLWLIPVGWPGAFAGFLLFRAFDIVKPYPARQLERLHGGLGVMADDVMAAVYANLALRALVAVWG